MDKNYIFKFIRALSAIGILLAVYMLWEQFSHFPSICSINATINCDAILSGPIKNTLGIPTPLYGLIGYIVIFIGSVLRKAKLTFAMATFGLAFCLWIAYRELFQLHVICPICIGCQLIMITVFGLSILALKKGTTSEVV
jgi:uncharacterized membrane protein